MKKNGMKRLAQTACLAGIAALLAGCPVAESAPTVYTAGFYDNGSQEAPCYWTGKTRTDLPGFGTNDAHAYSICASGGNTYTAGFYYDGSRHVPCY
ncbi:MAG: hypothetical protein JXD23_02430 [Spirochaetales bacterium]|nr:hypothetical protein [Spirochaetales bacterium]